MADKHGSEWPTEVHFFKIDLSLGERIKMARTKKLHWDQQALGRKIGVSGVSISKWERDETTIEARHLEKLAEAVGIDKVWFAEHIGQSLTPRIGMLLRMFTMLPEREQQAYLDVVEFVLVQRFAHKRHEEERPITKT
jgi:transcriptional regulator with XRE-family HTH domain